MAKRQTEEVRWGRGMWPGSEPSTQGSLEKTGPPRQESKTKAKVIDQPGGETTVSTNRRDKGASGEAARQEERLDILGKLRFESQKKKKITSIASGSEI